MFQIADKNTHTYDSDGRCRCGDLEVWWDTRSTIGYGCADAGVWADEVRRTYGPSTARVIRDVENRLGLDRAAAYEWVRDEILDDMESVG